MTQLREWDGKPLAPGCEIWVCFEQEVGPPRPRGWRWEGEPDNGRLVPVWSELTAKERARLRARRKEDPKRIRERLQGSVSDPLAASAYSRPPERPGPVAILPALSWQVRQQFLAADRLRSVSLLHGWGRRHPVFPPGDDRQH